MSTAPKVCAGEANDPTMKYAVTMGAQLERVAQEALALSTEERRRLVTTLMESIEQEVRGDHDAEWAKVARQRLEGVQSGDRDTYAWEEVRAGLIGE